MPEINEQKENYMSIDDFLTKYYAVFENKDYENTLFNRIMWETASKKPEDFDKWYQRLKDYIKPEESKELYAEKCNTLLKEQIIIKNKQIKISCLPQNS